MVILYYRSPYLRRILSTNKTKNDTLAHIKLPNILPEIFQIILRYIYGGTLSLETYETFDIIKILEAANELGLQELITYIQEYLIENKTNWMEQNFNLINQASFKHDSFLKLQKFCTDLMSKEPEKIFKSADFVLIPEKSLVTLVQNDNLQISEVQVWDYVLKWGLAQNPELSSDPSCYSKDDFNALKNTLKQCIPFVRFYNLTSKEFLDKVFPYKKVLPKELRVDLFKLFLNSDYKPSDKSRPGYYGTDSNDWVASGIAATASNWNTPDEVGRWDDGAETTTETTTNWGDTAGGQILEDINSITRKPTRTTTNNRYKEIRRKQPKTNSWW